MTTPHESYGVDVQELARELVAARDVQTFGAKLAELIELTTASVDPADEAYVEVVDPTVPGHLRVTTQGGSYELRLAPAAERIGLVQ